MSRRGAILTKITMKPKKTRFFFTKQWWADLSTNFFGALLGIVVTFGTTGYLEYCDKKAMGRTAALMTIGDIEYSIRKLEQHQKDSLVFLGKVGVGIDKESLEQGGYADYGLVFLLLDDEDEYEGDTVALPETDCVRIRFRGSHGDAPDRYRELIWYTAEQGLDITGFSREIALIDEGLTSDPAQFVTEICIPVR